MVDHSLVDQEVKFLNTLYVCHECKKDKILCSECNYHIDLSNKDTKLEFDSTYLKLFKLIETQVPQRPYHEEVSVINGSPVIYATCPHCYSQVNEWDSTNVCSTCGGALDWTDIIKKQTDGQ